MLGDACIVFRDTDVWFVILIHVPRIICLTIDIYKILSQVSCTCVRYVGGMTCDFYKQVLGMLVFSMAGSAGVETPLGSMEPQEQCVTSAVPEILGNSAGVTSLMMCTAQGSKVNSGQIYMLSAFWNLCFLISESYMIKNCNYQHL